MRNLLVCAAVEDELAGLVTGLRAGARGWRGEVEGVAVRAAAIGVGPVEAALGAAALFREADGELARGLASAGVTWPRDQAQRAALAAAERPRNLAILVGTCGAFPGSGLRIGDVALVGSSLLTASDAAAGLSYIPAPAAGAVMADESLVAAIASATGLSPLPSATVVAITKDGSRASALASTTGASVEHMEAYGFLRAARLAGIPAACLLGVANDVGPDGHAQWKRHAADAGAAAIDALRRFLRAGA